MRFWIDWLADPFKNICAVLKPKLVCQLSMNFNGSDLILLCKYCSWYLLTNLIIYLTSTHVLPLLIAGLFVNSATERKRVSLWHPAGAAASGTQSGTRQGRRPQLNLEKIWGLSPGTKKTVRNNEVSVAGVLKARFNYMIMTTYCHGGIQIELANNHKLTIKSTVEVSETETTFLDACIYKAERWKKRKESIVDVRTHFKTTKASVPIHTFLFVTP